MGAGSRPRRGFKFRDERRIRELIQQGAEVVAAEQQLEATPTALELAQRAFEKLSPEDKDQFRKAMAALNN